MTKIVGIYLWIFDDVAFGIAVRERRVARSLSQRQLALQCGFKTGTAISHIEGGVGTAISMDQFLNVCNILEIPPSDCFDLQRYGETSHG